MAIRRPWLSATRGEDGYAMIVTVIVIMVLTMLLVVVLAQSLHNNTISTRGARRSAALGVAEGGVNWAIAALQANRATAVVTNRAVPVADGSGGSGTATVTVKIGTPTSPSQLGYYTIQSTGQVATSGSPTRTVQVVMGPPASFTNAIYAKQSLRIENNSCIVGSVYARGDITFDTNSTIAGTSKARGDDEHAQRDEEHPPAAQQVRRAATKQQEAAIAEDVRAHHPLQRARGHAEVGLDRGKGNADHRHVERVEEQGAAEHQQRAPGRLAQVFAAAAQRLWR
jgi:hypothetical protein